MSDVGDIKTFDYIYTGLTLKVDVINLGGTNVKIIVTCVSGAADINALYWNDGIPDGSSFSLGTSLNMNGTGVDWDGGKMLSSTGLGSAGVNKATYLTTGETYVIESTTLGGIAGFDALSTLGVRATSTSTAEGSIKGVDGATFVECPHAHIDDVTVAEEAGSAVFTVTLEEAYLYDVTFTYTTTDGTAGSTDYTGTTSGTVTILAGHTSATITVPILDDSNPEPTETFTVTLTSATAVLPGTDLSVTACMVDTVGIGTITDTDTVPDPGPGPAPIPELGLSHGYWKEHLDDWGTSASPVATTTSFESIFGDHGSWDIDSPFDTDGAPYTKGAVVTDIDFGTALELGGGGQNLLAREAVAAYLNAIDEKNGVDYDYAYTPAQVIALVQDAFDDSSGLSMAQVIALLQASHDA